MSSFPVAPRIGLVGAPLDTGNLGVSALGLSTLAAVGRRSPDAQVTLFDNGAETRQETWVFPGGDVTVTHRGMWLSRRIHRPESLWRMLGSSLVAGSHNPNVASMAAADAVWDLSGGDSFSDIYGLKRYGQVALPKLVALQQARKLVLLPQTYGPFRSDISRRLARHIVRGSAEVWARDQESHARLRELMGPDFDPVRHRRSVDLAFTLPSAAPPEGLLGPLENWLDDDEPVVGVNVSGLLTWPTAREQFGLATDHEAALRQLVRQFLAAGLRVLLIPHVYGVIGEVDNVACRRLAASLMTQGRVGILPDGMDALMTKHVISRLAWMTGARMHATIAALSTHTPVTGIAYSDKMAGVFDSCGVREQVADARVLGGADLVDALWAGFESRHDTAETLAARVPAVVSTAEGTLDHLVSSLG